jgi:Lecithin retinol acyltransferase
MRPTHSTGEFICAGDWVRVYVQRLGVWHHGIVRRIFSAGNGFAVEIAHNTKASGTAVSDWYEFADGGVVHLHCHPACEAHAREILVRVESNLGKPYYLFAQNCEHFASFAFTGQAESKSVQALGWVAAVLLIIRLFGE